MPTPFHMAAFLKDELGDGPLGNPARHPPWEDRQAKLFWRGSLSIPDKTPFSLLESTPRMRLMRLGRERPDLFDVRITGVDESSIEFFTKEQKPQVFNMVDVGERVDSVSMYPRFKFVLNVGAVLSSWRLPELLASGALLFLQDNSDMELLHAQLQPWTHYVPIRNDLSDLVAKIDYFSDHDAEARSIARAGFAFFRSNATRARMLCYVWRTLRSIADNTDLTRHAVDRLLEKHAGLWSEAKRPLRSREYLVDRLGSEEL